MNKNMLPIFTLLIMATIITTSCSNSPHLIVNGGFEQVSKFEKSPGDWYPTIVPRTKDFVTFEWDDQVFHSGKKSVSIAISTDHPDDAIAYNWTKTIPGCKEGQTYEMSGWVKTEAMTGPAWIVVQCWDITKKEMLAFATTQKDYPISGTSDWVQVGTVFTVPAGTAEVRVRAGIAAPENRGGRVWFDELNVVLLDQ